MNMTLVVTLTSELQPRRLSPAEATPRIERLSTASLRRVIEPDTEVAGSVGPGQIVPRELLSVVDLDLDLTDEQWETLSREEVASIYDAGIRFESLLMAGFGLMLAWTPDLRDPRATYVLHEVGEETRHSRLFVRLLNQIAPTAINPLASGILGRVERYVTPRMIVLQANFCVLVLTGEEAPDLIQKRFAEHPDVDPFLRDISRYHRAEEARHLAFARMLLPELWEQASVVERFIVRRITPTLMAGLFDTLIHPGVYETVGLPGWRTWNAVRTSRSRRALRAEAFRPVLAALQNAGAFRRGRVPRGWRKVCQVDASGAALVT